MNVMNDKADWVFLESVEYRPWSIGLFTLCTILRRGFPTDLEIDEANWEYSCVVAVRRDDKML